MMNIFLFLFFLYTISLALEVNLKGAITDIAVGKNKLAVSTEKGKVFILNKESLSVEKEISLPDFTDFMGEKQKAKVFSVDLSPSEKRVLMVVESDLGKRTVFLFENGALKPILKLTNVSKGMFLDEDNIVLGTVANEIWLYNIKDKKTVYKYLVFRFVFSDFDFCFCVMRACSFGEPASGIDRSDLATFRSRLSSRSTKWASLRFPCRVK